MYCSGDHVRCDLRGQLFFAGRGDRQVKVRGHRVELAEIESAARALPAVTAAWAATETTPSGETQLWLGVQSETGEPELIRRDLARVLPPYAIPTRIVVRDHFPLTLSGKIDAGRVFEEPRPTPLKPGDRSPVAALVGGMWAKLLGRLPSGDDDNFFASGGNSLNAVRLLDDLHASLGVEISIRQFIVAPTFGALCAQIEAHGPATVDELTDIFDRFEQDDRG
jgi:hypothetical protein